MLLLGFVLGVMITISEPDLQVLAEQVPDVPNLTLILAILLLGMIFHPEGGSYEPAWIPEILVFSLPVTSAAGLRLVEGRNIC